MSYSSHGPSRARRDHSDDSKSRSEVTTTESSPACSTWADTFSSEPQSLPIDPPDGNGDEITKPIESSKRAQENYPTLVVKLPPEKPSPKKDSTRLGLRKRSESLEPIELPKDSESRNENTNTANGEVVDSPEKKEKDNQNKAKNTLKAVLSSLKNSKKFLLANSRPVSSACVEPSPVTSKESEPVPGTSQQSEPYVRQSVKDRVAAQSKLFIGSSTDPTGKTQSFNINTSNKGPRGDPSPGNGLNEFELTPPPPAPPDPIVKVKQVFYLTDGRIYEQSANNCPTEEDRTHENHIENGCLNTTSRVARRPPIKKVLFLDSTPNGLQSSFDSESTNTVGNSYNFETLPDDGSNFELRRFHPWSDARNLNQYEYENVDYDFLDYLVATYYEREHREKEIDRVKRSYQNYLEEEREFDRRNYEFHRQLLLDQLTDQQLIRASTSGYYEKQEDYLIAAYNNDLSLRQNQRFAEDTVIQPSSNTSRHPPQQGRQPTVGHNRDLSRDLERQYSDQVPPCSLPNDHNEPRRRSGQTQDRYSGKSQSRQCAQPRDIQTDQFQTREINQESERPLLTAEPLKAERTRLQPRQQQHTIQKKQPQAAPQSETCSNELQASTSKNYNDETQSNEPGDRPANSFWRRDFSIQIELESPLEAENRNILGDESRFAKGFERNKLPKVESSPSYRRRYPSTSENIYLEDFEEPCPNERYSNLYRERRNPPARRPYPERHMGRMGSLEDHERKVIIEFCHLLEKSKQLFNGLRELPQYGHKQWHSYFGRTFDVYTKLWKFQQQHRAILDTKYGLKRWQIGEIASKIGQLYYHFYLRTSETAYLNEAFSFYYAIRGRSYYTKACKEDKCELMVKKLRYYARFIVVCLLLKKIKLVRDLIKELDRQIIEYGNTYDPDDQIEWTVVVDEVKAFIQTEPVVSVIHPDSYPVLLSHRLSPLTTPPVERSQQMTLSLQEVLIVGSSSQQVKFSELTMDMFRMLQTLEREPTGEIQHMYDDSPRQRFNLTPSALNNKGYNLETGGPRSDNPHKYLLFRPSPSQILVYLASGCNDLPPNGVLLLYISADGQIVQPSKHPEDGYDIGGLITTSKNELYRDSNKEKSSQAKNRELQCFHPGDLYPFTRRPLFIIIDSDNSVVFQNIPRHFGQPMVILMSPVEMPSGLHITQSERKHQGSLFTLFLHSPLTAICYCNDLHSVPLIHWDRAQTYIDTFVAEASQLVTRGRIDPMFLNFMGDDFLRLLILRYMFCELVLRMHRAFRTRTQRPRSAPGIPDEMIEHPALVHIVFDLATHLQIRPSFQEPNGNLERTSKE